ncbi:MAG TPA: carbohydrate-binding family 9-like protein, partial [Verrucomicrobiae bacterium]
MSPPSGHKPAVAGPPRRLQLFLGFVALMRLVLAGGEIRGAPATPSTTTLAGQPVPLPIQVDGELNEPAWSRAEIVQTFVYPWSNRVAPSTEFRALVDAERLYLAFEVSDGDIVLEKDFAGESTLDREDRVEIFFARDNALARYFCLEIDPLGRVHDYAASFYRKFDSDWNCPGLRAAGRIHAGGYTVEAAIPLPALAGMLERLVSPGSILRVGIFRAEFRQGAAGDADDNWLSWVKPNAPKPDFHVASAFADWHVPAVTSAAEGAFLTRGVVLVPEDLPSADWPARAARAGLTTIALHHGTSTTRVAEFIESPPGREFLTACARLGLHVEYELHAMSDLLPRSLFAQQPESFRMNEQGARIA